MKDPRTNRPRKAQSEWVKPLTDAEVEAIKKLMSEAAAQHGFSDIFTCDECASNRTCIYAYDAYCTQGDCLAEK